MKWIKINHRIILFIFSIVVIPTGIYIPDRDVNSVFSYAEISHLVSAVNETNKRIDLINENSESLTNEIRIKHGLGINNIVSNKNNSNSLNLFAVLASATFISWAIINLLQQKEFINRLYIILFIHNSDGKKR